MSLGFMSCRAGVICWIVCSLHERVCAVQAYTYTFNCLTTSRVICTRFLKEWVAKRQGGEFIIRCQSSVFGSHDAEPKLHTWTPVQVVCLSFSHPYSPPTSLHEHDPYAEGRPKRDWLLRPEIEVRCQSLLPSSTHFIGVLGRELFS